jgi:hypothetical protein
MLKPRRLINFKISVTWAGGLFTSFKMMFFNSDEAVRYAMDLYGIEPKIEVKPA